MPKKYFYAIIYFMLIGFLPVMGQTVPTLSTDSTNNSESVYDSNEELPEIDYNSPKEYTIAAISISGNNNYDEYVLIGYSGLKVGQKIIVPSDVTSTVVQRFWKQGLFTNVRLEIAGIQGNNIWLNIHLDQRPKISEINFTGAKKKEKEELEKSIGISKGSQITPYLIDKAKKVITDYYHDKGYYYARVSVVPREEDSTETIVDIKIEKGNKITPIMW